MGTAVREACDGTHRRRHGLADALDAAATYIAAQKAAAIVELTTMAAAFAADQAAAVATLGLAEAAVPAVVATARALTRSLAQDLEQHMVAEVVEASAKPLFEKISQAVVGLDWSQQTSDHGLGDLLEQRLRRRLDHFATHVLFEVLRERPGQRPGRRHHRGHRGLGEPEGGHGGGLIGGEGGGHGGQLHVAAAFWAAIYVAAASGAVGEGVGGVDEFHHMLGGQLCPSRPHFLGG